MNFRKKSEISGHGGAVYTCAAEGNYIYSGSADKFVARWLVNQGTQDSFAIQFENSIYALELLNNNHLVCGLSNGDIHVFDLLQRKEIKFIKQHLSGIFAIEQMPKTKRFIVGDADGNISIWRHSMEQEIVLPLNIGKIRAIAVSEDEMHFAVGGQDGIIRIFETEHYNEIASWFAHESGVTSLAFHSFEVLFSGGKDAHISRWNWKKEELLKRIPAHNFAVYDLKLIRQNQLLISASRDKTIKVWNSDDLSIIKRLDRKEGGHSHSVNSLAVIDDSHFVSCSDDGKVIVWENS